MGRINHIPGHVGRQPLRVMAVLRDGRLLVLVFVVRVRLVVMVVMVIKHDAAASTSALAPAGDPPEPGLI